MTRKMKDLKREVHERIEHLDGQWFENGNEMELPHMLGIMEPGEYDVDKLDGTLLDPEHDFWSEYIRDMHSGHSTQKEVALAIELLKEDGILEIQDSDNFEGIYVSVEQANTDADSVRIEDIWIERDGAAKLVLYVDGMEYETSLRARPRR